MYEQGQGNRCWDFGESLHCPVMSPPQTLQGKWGWGVTLWGGEQKAAKDT